jgi:antitoxin component YwqK of YwqJK toxin-antitoxin module
MKEVAILLLIMISLGCQNSEKEKLETKLDCSNAIVDKNIVDLMDYNKSFFDENYTGLVQSYYDKDDKKRESVAAYENGEIISYKSFYENGNPKIVKPVKCQSTHGNLVYHYENGEKAYELYFYLGAENGIGKSYFENGKLEKVVHFENGKKHGIQYDLSEKGDTLSFEVFENGIKIR